MTTIKLRADEVYKIAKTVGRFANAEDLSYNRNGVLIDASAEGVFAVATDGHRLGKLALNPIVDEYPVEHNFLHILPPEAVKWCGALKVTYASAHLPVTLEFRDGRVTFTFFEASASFALLEGAFAEWRRVMAKPEKSRIVFSAKSLKDVCEAIKSHCASGFPVLEIAFDSSSSPARIVGGEEGLEIILMPRRL